jgi:glycerol-3-phosphate dehydrogenase subunit C
MKGTGQMEECTIRVSRFNPEVDERSALQEYKVPRVDQGTVIAALMYVYEEIDSTLFFNYGCRYKLCGKCAIKINGQPRLACETPLEDGMVLEPLDNLPIIRDLAVDRSGLLEPLRKYDLVYSADQEPEVAIQPPEFSQLMRCNECLSCLSNCPAFKEEIGYGGPFFGVKLAELYYDVRDGKKQLSQLESFLDQCIQCRQCDVNCPWDVDFSEISSKIKGEAFKHQKVSLRDWLMSRPHFLGLLASSASSFFNALPRNKSIRKIMDALLKIDERAPFPEYHPGRIIPHEAMEGMAKRKVAYFVGCFDRFNDPDTARNSLFVLEANGLEAKAFDPGCCGAPFIGLGDLESAKKRAIAVSRELKKLIRGGYDIVASCTSCGAMMKCEYPFLFDQLKEDEFQSRIHNLGDYLWHMHEAGQLDTNYKEIKRRVGYHSPCHLKAQKIGAPFVDLLRLIPGLEVAATFDKCCGMAGTMGFKKERYDLSQEIGNPLMIQVRDTKLDMVLSDCASCQMKIRNDAKVDSVHPITVIREAMQ